MNDVKRRQTAGTGRAAAMPRRAGTTQQEHEPSTKTRPEADLGMFSMFGRTGAPQKAAPQEDMDRK